ncbi:uncharacterized protein LOC123705943 [Colias croceus]|uniref:uncharacterized protein LOC123705943 n=1 Tax=Colias crocea TaxID=72248 RepID=UPI001E280B49|nr:uncharacterized protein LOC123705943 [Colias croceus]
MTKCNGCGKFVSSTEGVKCYKCSGVYDRICIKLSKTYKVPNDWLCPGCVSKLPRRDNTETPIKSFETPTARANPPSDYNHSTILEELHAFRSDMRSQLAMIREDIAGFSDKMEELSKTVDCVTQRLETIEQKVETLENSQINSSSSAELQNTITQLKKELNDRDQECLLMDVDITGIPETPGENLQHVISLVAKKLAITLDANDIVHAQRSGPQRSRVETNRENSPRPISVRFARRSLRDNFLKNARVRRGADTTDLSPGNNPRRFYVNERLTYMNRQLFHKARLEGCRLKWRYVWTKDGRVYARRDTDTVVKRIRSEADFETIFGSG